MSNADNTFDNERETNVQLKGIRKLTSASIETNTDKKVKRRAVVVAQLVERLLPISDVRRLNPIINKIYIEHLFTVNCIEKTKKKTRPGMAYLKVKKKT